MSKVFDFHLFQQDPAIYIADPENRKAFIDLLCYMDLPIEEAVALIRNTPDNQLVRLAAHALNVKNFMTRSII